LRGALCALASGALSRASGKALAADLSGAAVMKNPLCIILAAVRAVCALLHFFIYLPLLGISRLWSQHAALIVARSCARGLLCILGVSLRIKGSAASWRDRSIIVCNHIAYLDILVVLAGLKRPFIFVADHSTFRVPGLALAMRFCGCIPISQGSPASIRKCLTRAEAFIRGGCSVMIFPEGGINRTGDVYTLMRVSFGFKCIADTVGAAVYQITLYGCERIQRSPFKFWQYAGVHLHPSPVYQGASAAEGALPREERRLREELAARLTARNREAAMALAGVVE